MKMNIPLEKFEMSASIDKTIWEGFIRYALLQYTDSLKNPSWDITRNCFKDFYCYENNT